MLSLLSAQYINNYNIQCTFSTGETGIADLSEFVKRSPFFAPLLSHDFFSRFTVNYTIIWSCDFDVAPEYLYFLAFKEKKEYEDLFTQWGYLQIA
jgi:hypothetical protein